LSVADDGPGFELTEARRPAYLGRLGIMGMQERAELLGAEFWISSRPGVGTRIEVRLPTED
jgi:signal transduction histidine kinase